MGVLLLFLESEHHADDERKGRSGIIRLGAIKDVINRVSWFCFIELVYVPKGNNT